MLRFSLEFLSLPDIQSGKEKDRTRFKETLIIKMILVTKKIF